MKPFFFVREKRGGTGRMGLVQGDWQHLHGISNDMARMVTTMQAVEQACAALQVLPSFMPGFFLDLEQEGFFVTMPSKQLQISFETRCCPHSVPTETSRKTIADRKTCDYGLIQCDDANLCLIPAVHRCLPAELQLRQHCLHSERRLNQSKHASTF